MRCCLCAAGLVTAMYGAHTPRYFTLENLLMHTLSQGGSLCTFLKTSNLKIDDKEQANTIYMSASFLFIHSFFDYEYPR